MRRHYSREQVDSLIQVTGSATMAREVLDCLGAVSGVWYLRESEQVQFAHRLLSDKVPRVDVRDRLVSRFGISKSRAYARITEALKQRLL
jgi:hypothetical protein